MSFHERARPAHGPVLRLARMLRVSSRGVRILLFGAAGVAAAGCQPSREAVIAQNQATINHYCLDCHSYAEQTGNLTLEHAKLDSVAADPEKWEHVVRKLRAGMMPPPGNPRPPRETYVKLASWLEGELDHGAVEQLPPPGIASPQSRGVRQRGPRSARARHRPRDLLPRGRREPRLRQPSRHARALARAARGVFERGRQDHPPRARQGVEPTQAMYRVATDETQNYHVEGLPFGTRGGLVVEHEFPEDATYNFKVYSVNLGNMGNFRPFGEIRGEKLEVLVDGARVALVDWDEAFGLNKPGFGGFSGQLKTIDVKVPVSAGPHRVGVTFLATNYAPGLDMNRAFERSTIETGGLPGYTFYPHIGSVRVDGPYDASGAGDTPSRERILTCTPNAPTEERPCAERILRTLASAGYRGMQTDERRRHAARVLRPGTRGRRLRERDRDRGRAPARRSEVHLSRRARACRRRAGQHIPGQRSRARVAALVLPLEQHPGRRADYRSRSKRKLADPAVLEKQVRRMLADPRSEALTANFAGQWLDLRALEGHVPVAALFPDFDDNLRQSFGGRPSCCSTA